MPPARLNLYGCTNQKLRAQNNFTLQTIGAAAKTNNIICYSARRA